MIVIVNMGGMLASLPIIIGQRKTHPPPADRGRHEPRIPLSPIAWAIPAMLVGMVAGHGGAGVSWNTEQRPFELHLSLIGLSHG